MLPSLSASERRWIAWLVLVAALLRGAFLLLRSGPPPYDPWRHLQLVENIRAGLGFTLFDGQPYIWYSPLWHYLAAAMPREVGMDWLAALFSVLTVPLVYLLLRGSDAQSRWVAAAGAGLTASFGPLIAFTCHYGPEALALFLMLAGIVLARSDRRVLVHLVAGLLFGSAVILRLNMAFNVFLFLPVLRHRPRAVALGVGMAIPVALGWLRNLRVVGRFDWLFTWDGLATSAAEFGFLSPLVIQMHPSVREGLRRLHEIVVPQPEWTQQPDMALFMALALLALFAARRLDLMLAGLSGLGYFLLFDRSLSSNFFRIYLALFPVVLIAFAWNAAWFRRRPGGRLGQLLAYGSLLLVVACGARHLIPPPMVSLQTVTPPAELLTEDAYMVNSGFYHPESLMYRFPDKRFIGMPLMPDEFDAFAAAHPQYRAVLWHDFNVQPELGRYLEQQGYRGVAVGRNAAGRRYVVLEPPALTPDSPAP